MADKQDGQAVWTPMTRRRFLSAATASFGTMTFAACGGGIESESSTAVEETKTGPRGTPHAPAPEPTPSPSPAPAPATLARVPTPVPAPTLAAAPPPPALGESASGTTIPLATQIVDYAGAVWTLRT